ncbi:cupin domain-containing protein [Brumimicrobium oceani]|uniref:Cupin n=1 Tax=Brumimicrobium oceani TaxID=2100725 RepID=A0A2U2X1D5_9FLAO|nr:cupin domain-containing protein [Brumimicrobium oceani]PWH81592.1 cupin [Brumimicrobium oceani]
MESNSFLNDLSFTEDKVRISVILESSFSKEIRIAFKKGQVMKEHKTPFPIVVHLLEGAIEFGVEGDKHQLKKGDILTLEGNVPHDLLAKEESVVRLTLSKLDTADRVKEVAENSK